MSAQGARFYGERMPADLDRRDLAEVRRRVAEPVLRSLVRVDELDQLTVVEGDALSSL